MSIERWTVEWLMNDQLEENWKEAAAEYGFI
jgi:hypothetical protein